MAFVKDSELRFQLNKFHIPWELVECYKCMSVRVYTGQNLG